VTITAALATPAAHNISARASRTRQLARVACKPVRAHALARECIALAVIFAFLLALLLFIARDTSVSSIAHTLLSVTVAKPVASAFNSCEQPCNASTAPWALVELIVTRRTKEKIVAQTYTC
jgi:hypothetical protein